MRFVHLPMFVILMAVILVLGIFVCNGICSSEILFSCLGFFVLVAKVDLD